MERSSLRTVRIARASRSSPMTTRARWGSWSWTIPGGEYAHDRLKNWEDHIPEIGRTFERIARECERDPSRPSVEFYRSQKELVLLFPVKGAGRALQDP